MADDDAVCFEDVVENCKLSEFRQPNSIASPVPREIAFDDIATKLIKENCILTALELHAELTESGRELPRLRDYFSNPGNFERQADLRPEFSPGLPRTASVQTFDSLDFARYSDDGDRQVDERVAVLEFELRKARETIRSLRANLTEAAESEAATPDSNIARSVTEEPIKLHEKRALNYLVNDYLLKHNYKLTSNTFADENEDQDFEDWDDVGLNCPQPPPLLHLYRDFGRHLVCTVETVNQGVQVTLELDQGEESEEHGPSLQELKEEVFFLHHEIEILGSENLTLLTKLKNLQMANGEEKEFKAVEYVMDDLGSSEKDARELKDVECEMDGLGSSEKNAVSSFVETQEVYLESPIQTVLDGSNCQLDHNESLLAGNDDLSYPELQRPVDETESSYSEIIEHTMYFFSNPERHVSAAFQKALLDLCYVYKALQGNRLASEVTQVVNSSDKVILMLGRSLPHIVPNVILAKREELIPLILCTISLHPNPKERDKLLNILFNLIKRPNIEQRQMILTGVVVVAQHLGPSRVESELLPQCWEQISHRYAERRLLVAEACGVLMPFLPNEIRSSLVFSMLQQMLEDDKTDAVRETAIRSLALLMAYIDDSDKYTQGLNMLMSELMDSSEKVASISLQVLMPSFAAWSRDLGRLEKDLITTIVHTLRDKISALSARQLDLVDSPQPSHEERGAITLCHALQGLLSWLFVSVIESGPFAEKASARFGSLPVIDIGRFPSPLSPLVDITVIADNERHLAALLSAFEDYISQEWYQPWEKFEWVTRTFIPSMVQILGQLDVCHRHVLHSLVRLFLSICRLFGRHFTQTKVKPVFQDVLRVLDDELAAANQNSSKMTILTQGIVPVYTSGVLAAFSQDEDRKELSQFLIELLCTFPLCRLPIDSLKATVIELRLDAHHHDVLLGALWDGVVHTSAIVRSTAASMFELLVGSVSESVLSARVAPALVTLASDPEISVRIATVPAFGTILDSCSQKDLLDKAQLQFQTFLDDPIYRDQVVLHIEIIRTFNRIITNAEQRFRDDFILPHLAALANICNHVTNDFKRAEMSLVLLEAFSALGCCMISDQLIQELMLPGLRCLLVTVQQLVPENAEVVIAMIREYEAKTQPQKPLERSYSITSNSMGAASMEDVRNRMTKMFSTKAAAKTNIQQIFQIRKK